MTRAFCLRRLSLGCSETLSGDLFVERLRQCSFTQQATEQIGQGDEGEAEQDQHAGGKKSETAGELAGPRGGPSTEPITATVMTRGNTDER